MKRKTKVTWIVLALIGVAIVLLGLFHHQLFDSTGVALQENIATGREPPATGRADRYFVELTLSHNEPQPVTGVYTIRAYGDVLGAAGEDSPEGRNFYRLPVHDAAPGQTAGVVARFYTTNSQLKANGLTPDFVYKHARLAFVVDFQGTAADGRKLSQWWVFGNAAPPDVEQVFKKLTDQLNAGDMTLDAVDRELKRLGH